jgi:UPF0755 protein
MIKKTLLAIFLVGPLLGLGLASIHIYIVLNSGPSGETKEFEIAPGETFPQINYRLHKQGLISNTRIFHYYTKYQNKLNKFKSGVYAIQKGQSMIDILEELTNGKSLLTNTTIPEGKNLYQIADILKSEKIISNKKNFIKLAQKSDYLLKKYGITAQTSEGYLYPNTYNFSKNMSSNKVLEALIDQHFISTKDINFKHPKLSRHQIIILASVVEKETGAKFERPLIAGVFLNRLQKKMRLQSDPTTIYGIYETFDGNLRRSDLRNKTSYNTYAIAGLPIGPISNPGKDAINAVLKPEKHDFLYFVSKNNGTHVFSKTYKEHEKAVNYWQKIKSNREGKSWRDLKQ